MSHKSSKKRGVHAHHDDVKKKSGGAKPPVFIASKIGLENLPFEDPFGDEYEDEEYDDAAIEKEMDENYVSDEDNGSMQDVYGDYQNPKEIQRKEVWRPGIDKLGEGEELEYDPSAYIMYHSMSTEWPCLSFDVLRDNLGDARQRFPHAMCLVMGSQADRSENNKVTLLKLSDLHKTGGQASESDEEEDHAEEDFVELDEDPTLEHINAAHSGGVNRIRSMPQDPGVVATMSDTSALNIFNFRECYTNLMSGQGPRTAPQKPCWSYLEKGSRKQEGFALDWSKAVSGCVATGDLSGNIQIFDPEGSMPEKGPISSWSLNGKHIFTSQTLLSVEDIQWSPSERTVFISGGVDQKVHVWDVRGKNGPQISFKAHTDDINVVSWNSKVHYLLASGCDDGSFKVWDLRYVKKVEDDKIDASIASFSYHKEAITSIEWAPHDESVITASSADDCVTIWDMSVEADEIEGSIQDFPPQLLFIHQGQQNVKEAHWHPQIPGVCVTTAEDGINIFKPSISVEG